MTAGVLEMEDQVALRGVYSATVSLAAQKNNVPLVRSLVLENQTGVDLTNLAVTVRVEPEVGNSWTREIALLPAGSLLDIGEVPLRLSEAYLRELSQRTQLRLMLSVQKGDELLGQWQQPFDVLPYNEWSGVQSMPEILCAFVTPEHPRIASLVEGAQKASGRTFNGYESRDPNSVRLQMEALYQGLQEEAFQYCPLPAGALETGGQVRLCGDLHGGGTATCLEIALLYTACLERVGLHPLLVLLEGHVLPGCWLEDKSFAEWIQDDLTQITGRMEDGIHQIEVIEGTCVTSGSKLDFAAARKAAWNHLQEPAAFFLALDIHRARASGILSMDMPATAIPDAEPTMGKQQIWERHLLDLSLRNTLLNFRVTKKTIPLMISEPERLEDHLAKGREFHILERPSSWDTALRDIQLHQLHTKAGAVDVLIQSELKSGRLHAFLDEQEVQERLSALYRWAKISLEENGANTLYLALGFLKWYESPVSERVRYAPVVLIPVDLIRQTARGRFVLKMRDEDPQMNITLLEMLRQDFGIQVEGLDPLPRDDFGVDLRKVFALLRQAVHQCSRWEVEETAFLGMFSFSHFIMWNDIRNRGEDLKKNKIVASLMSGKLEWVPTVDFPNPATLDDEYSPADIAVPISADSSQLAAICAAGQDKSFVLHGPPGTGKSQTITNIIANALYQGKSVLFIAEKMAALSVVQKRLEAIGLAPFCLELHSNKAKKKDVLEQLRQTLEIGRVKPQDEYRTQAVRLARQRKKLNSYVKALHQKRRYGFSLYEAIARYEQYKDAPAGIDFAGRIPEDFCLETFQAWEDAVRDLQAAWKLCGMPGEHPLREMTISAYSRASRDRIKKMIAELRQDLQICGEGWNAVEEYLGLPSRHLSHGQMGKTASYLEEILRSDYISPDMLRRQNLSGWRESIAQVCQWGALRDAAREELEETFEDTVFQLDEASLAKTWKMAEASWFLPRWIKQRRVYKVFKLASRTPKAYKKERTPESLAVLHEFWDKEGLVQERQAEWRQLFGDAWRDGRPDWKSLEAMFDTAQDLQELAVQIEPDQGGHTLLQRTAERALQNLDVFRRQTGGCILELTRAWLHIAEMEEQLSDEAGIDFKQLHQQENAWVPSALEMAERWQSGIGGLRDWCGWNRACEQATGIGLGAVVDAIVHGQLQAGTALESFYQGFYLTCAQEIADEVECLRNFNGPLFEEAIAKYRDTTKRFEQLTRSELAAKLSAKIPHLQSGVSVADSSEIGILQRAIKSGGRMMPIRRLFEKIPNLLRKLCPCMLMSPISVAQYIDPTYPPFDLIVFDQASQLPTCEAAGAIARGKSVIIVGDPKQLPPTNFFAAGQMDEDNMEQEDLESILDDCLAIAMPQEHLLWHYRSRHESLIAFSNRQFYENRLLTFPSPNDRISKVKLVEVEGYYDRGRSRQNLEEARAVVEEIIRRLQDPVLSRQSIGVVTFSSVQQNLIDDMLWEAFSERPELEELNDNAEEPIFIKNLENVQGDERDVILFSIGYGPDKEGKVALNFGPLNRTGGWRRLNVAVSRARYEMIVYSVLQPEQIDLSRTMAEGVIGLKAFLEYAKRGKRALPAPEEPVSKENEALLRLIANQIAQRGYQVRTSVGTSQYRIDIGVIHPKRPEEYILAILLDGSRYRDTKTSRDRNLLQISVLRSLGWHVHRLWILDWWENEGEQLNQIERHIHEILRVEAEKGIKHATIRPGVKEVKTEFETFDQEETALPNGLEEYRIEELQEAGSPDEFYDSENNELILSQAEQILEIEGPISEDNLCRRLMGAWGIQRLSARVEARFQEIRALGAWVRTTGMGVTYYWAKGMNPRQYTGFRVPPSEQGEELRRDLDDIAPEELAAAVRFLLEQQVSLPRSDLVREICRLFGFARTSPAIEEKVMLGVKKAVDLGYVTLEETGRVVYRQ